MQTREQSALILIEFQQEWLDEDGKINHLMHDREQFHSAIAAAKQTLETARFRLFTGFKLCGWTKKCPIEIRLLQNLQ
ncbi:MAG: hypothetical protein KME42_08165 [Tildeniella nuda ZEHNDER 1965/U140]|jgi:hypothetical protein|nr:hypothetical protein [Tildeniella nuda ZEHNDER 1965/U140]